MGGVDKGLIKKLAPIAKKKTKKKGGDRQHPIHTATAYPPNNSDPTKDFLMGEADHCV